MSVLGPGGGPRGGGGGGSGACGAGRGFPMCRVLLGGKSLDMGVGGSGVVIKVPEGEGKEYQEPVEQAEDFQCVVYFWEVGLWTWGRGGVIKVPEGKGRNTRNLWSRRRISSVSCTSGR